MDMGVDGIITNYPNHVREIMAERGMRLPKAYAGSLIVVADEGGAPLVVQGAPPSSCPGRVARRSRALSQ